MSGTLYIIPTPIGNMEDITFRAIRLLKSVDMILTEDTRVSGKLLSHFSIKTPMKSYHTHNEHKIVSTLVKELSLRDNKKYALITDAGTPAISDPGYLLIKHCIAQKIKIECLPGATAFVPALVSSGLPTDAFTFIGFLPVRKGRQKKLEELKEETKTMIFYESPHRIVRTLQDLAGYFGKNRPASVSRELSKLYEEHIRGSLEEIIQQLNEKKTKGEFVIIVNGKRKIKSSLGVKS